MMQIKPVDWRLVEWKEVSTLREASLGTEKVTVQVTKRSPAGFMIYPTMIKRFAYLILDGRQALYVINVTTGARKVCFERGNGR